MDQTRLESIVESTFNNGSGFLISICLFEYVVKPLYDNGMTQNSIVIVSMFTVVSMLRSYFWRRFFNRGLHRWIHRTLSYLLTRRPT